MNMCTQRSCICARVHTQTNIHSTPNHGKQHTVHCTVWFGKKNNRFLQINELGTMAPLKIEIICSNQLRKLIDSTTTKSPHLSVESGISSIKRTRHRHPYLHTMDNKTWGCVQLLVTHMTLKVPRFLVLYKNLLIFKLSVAVPAPWLQWLLLLSSHCFLLSALTTYCSTVCKKIVLSKEENRE